MIHLYYGEGKGKTTAAMGLALRALGHGKRVVIVQFLKDGKSGELAPLKFLGAFVFSGNSGTKFFSQMDDKERRETRMLNDRNLEKAMEIPCDLLIFDEACAACRLGMVNEEHLRKAVSGELFSRNVTGLCGIESEERAPSKAEKRQPEIVLTGRNPSDWMLETADYITEMKKERHPFENGVRAREGIEY